MQNGQPLQGVLAVLRPGGPGSYCSARKAGDRDADESGRQMQHHRPVGIAAARGVVVPVIGVDPAIALEVLGT